MKTVIIFILHIVFAINALGQSWVAQTSGTTQNLNCVFFIGKDTGYAAGNGLTGGTLLKTINGGITWNSLIFPSTYNIYGIYFTSVDTGYALTGNTQLYKTTNGGSTWTYIRNMGYYGSATMGGYAVCDMYFQNNNLGYIKVYGLGKIWRTMNGGITWDSTTGYGTACGACQRALNFISPTTGFTLFSSNIYKTTNSGISWSYLATPTTNPLNDIKFISNNIGFVVGTLSNNIMRTNNGGSTWFLVPIGLTVVSSKKLIFTSQSKAVMLNQSSNCIIVSNDTCNSWTPMGIYPSFSSFNDLFMVNDSIGYAVGDFGQIYKTFPNAAAPPTLAASNLFTSNVTNNGMTINWTNGNGNRRIVVARENNNLISSPNNGITYSANSNFGAGSPIGAGNFVVYDGTGSSCNINGLNLGTAYFFRVYEYNGTGSTANYLTSSYASGGAATLPVNWLNFSAELNNENSVRLNWSTASEINNSHFEIERSTDNINWTKVNTVKGNGNTDAISKYNYTDIFTTTKTNYFYYRLKQVDFDGRFEYSKTVDVSLYRQQINNFYIFYPNPNNGQFTIDFYDNREIKTIRLFDTLGKIVKEITTADTKTYIEANQLDKGIYLISVQSHGDNYFSRILIN